METKRLILRGGELRDLPGCWKISGRYEDESDEWSVLRRPDGSFCEIAGIHYFPPSGETVRIEIGDQILDRRIIDECEGYYSQLRQKAASADVRL
jgi:hypothetical protein